MSTSTQYLSKGQYRAAKSRLTRAINSKDPLRVIDTVRAQFTEWDEGNYAYPDDWSRWYRAAEDATLARRRAGDYADC